IEHLELPKPRNPYQPGAIKIFPEEISAKIELTKMDFDNAFNTASIQLQDCDLYLQLYGLSIMIAKKDIQISKKKSLVAPAQKASSIKSHPKKCLKNLQKSRDKEETDYLLPYTQINASISNDCPSQVYIPKLCSTKFRSKRSRGPKTIKRKYCYQDGKEIEENTEAFKAEIGHANEIYNYGPCYNKIEKNEVKEPDSETDINSEDNEALKVVEKVAKIDHMNKIFEPKDVKVLDAKYYTKEPLYDELFERLSKNYSSSISCLNIREEQWIQETDLERNP
ncbi:23394_t:CDS:2, partial [Gigaspora margarita]